jgi:hypothetical protein
LSQMINVKNLPYIHILPFEQLQSAIVHQPRHSPLMILSKSTNAKSYLGCRSGRRPAVEYHRHAVVEEC